MIGMHVGLHSHRKRQVQFSQQCKVSVHGRYDRIHEDGFSGLLTGEQVGICVRQRFQQLMKNHGITTLLSFIAQIIVLDHLKQERWTVSMQ